MSSGTTRTADASDASPRVPLLTFARHALWMGIVGFGGGWSVSQRIRRTVVEERRWLTEGSFVETFAVSSALPGTTATNLLTMLGARLAGLPGAALGALGFLLPSMILMIAFGAEYARLRGVLVLAQFLDGMSFVTVGVVAAVAIDLRRSQVRTRLDYGIAVGAALALVTRSLNLLEVILIAGFTGALILREPPDEAPPRTPSPPPAPTNLVLAALPLATAASLSLALFLVFARIGIATFGGGFAMIPPIEHEVVNVNGWLDERAFNDAMVLGQVTPGPVAIAATFIGYRVAGLPGSLASTLGIFGPPFVLSVVVARSLAAFRSNGVVQGFLRGVSPAVVGVILAASVSLWRTSVHSSFGAGVALAALVVLARFPRLSPLVPLAVGGLVTVAFGQ